MSQFAVKIRRRKTLRAVEITRVLLTSVIIPAASVQHGRQLAAIDNWGRRTEGQTDRYDQHFKCSYLLKLRKQFIIAIAVDAVAVAHKQTRVKYSIKCS